jgi:RNA polymerase sigma factor (sigma-70 family)
MTRAASEDALLPSTAELARLMRAAQDRTPESLSGVIMAIRPWLVRYFRAAFTGDEAEDLAQMVVIRFARRMSRPDGGPDPDRVGKYIVMSARNLAERGAAAHRIRRDSRRQVDLETIPDAADTRAEQDPDAIVQRRALECAIAVACREQLKPGERAILGRLLLGDSMRDIALAADVNPATMRKRASRLRQKLRSLLAPYLNDPGASHLAEPSALHSKRPVRRNPTPGALPAGSEHTDATTEAETRETRPNALGREAMS